MPISYLEPLSRAFSRMKKALFQPFQLNTWFTVAFTAFLAGLMDFGHGSGAKYNADNRHDFEEFFLFPRRAYDWLAENPLWFTLILFGALVFIVILIVLLWLSSRGKFMFLDNVVQGRALVTQPWREFGRLAHSLFVWRLVFAFAGYVIVIGFLAYVWREGYERYLDNISGVPLVLFILEIVITFILIITVLAYVALLLNDFVVPVMYKHHLTAVQAWRRFLPLHWQHFGSFILYALLILLLMMVIGIAVVIGGCFTCCIGFLLMAVPYVSSVVLLPVSYTFRAFSVEFLAQFGEEFSVKTSE